MFCFVIFELCILPIAYLKTWVNLIRNKQGLWQTLWHLFLYLTTGPFIKFWLMLCDISLFAKILSYYQGCRIGKIDELAEEEINDELKVKIYNETRATIITLYKKLNKYVRK